MTAADSQATSSATTNRLPPAVLNARQRMTEGRQKLRAQHAQGSPGIQVCAALTQLIDDVVLDLRAAALAEEGVSVERFDELAALVPYGGFGRRDVAPFSDVDLMLLVDPRAETELKPVLRRFTNSLYDVFQMGYSQRTVAEACHKSLEDPTILTSLAEARFLAGSQPLFDRFQTQFLRQVKRRGRGKIAAIAAARREERRKVGDTNYLLEPNIKKSRGGLRDIQLIRWLGFLVCGEVELDNMTLTGVLAREDAGRLREAREFLLRTRNELHFHAGREQDVLNKGEQLRLAQLGGYQGDEGMLPVEQFMQRFFQHTSEVRYIAANFLADAQPSPGLLRLLGSLVSNRYEKRYRVGLRQISVARKYLEEVASDPAEVLKLMELGSLFNKRIDHRTWSSIRREMIAQTPRDLTPDAARLFLSLLGQPAQLGEQLRRLHELRVLEKLVPPMAHARCLLQFNDYHKFTVDEHSFRAVESAVEFRNRTDTLGIVCNQIKRKDLLHLALLLHDLGKGFKEDHSVLGSRMAEETCQRLGMPEADVEIVRLLVLKHLVMSQLAQWRDTSDPKVIIQFAVDVGSPEVLKMLYVLTCADLHAVGPGVLNDWKLRLLTDLYYQTLPHIAGDAPADPRNREVAAFREHLRKKIAGATDHDWWDQLLNSLPRTYLLDGSPDRLAEQLEKIRLLPRNEAVAWGEYLPQQKAVQYTVGTYEDIAPGIFHRLTGAISSKGLAILAAEIHTLMGSLVLDRFYVRDDHYGDKEPPQERIDEVCQALVAALRDTSGKTPNFGTLWKYRNQSANAALSQMPTKVRIDNTTSERQTIVDVFTLDRMGLLYNVTRALFDLGLSVHVAKIGTHLDQVVDVFYVTDRQGRKVDGSERIKEIRQRLLDAIEACPSAAT